MLMISKIRIIRSDHNVAITLYGKKVTFLIQAHRVVLAACSDYFRAMFCAASDFREGSQRQVVLAGVSAAGVSHLLDYVYTARLRLSLANVHEVLSAATHLQVDRAVEACAAYLRAQLDVDNCVDVATLAEAYFLVGLRAKAYKFISENLAAFSAKQDLLHRLSANQMEHLLDSNFPVDVPEEAVLEMLLNWLDFERSSRMAHAHKYSFFSPYMVEHLWII